MNIAHSYRHVVVVCDWIIIHSVTTAFRRCCINIEIKLTCYINSYYIQIFQGCSGEEILLMKTPSDSAAAAFCLRRF